MNRLKIKKTLGFLMVILMVCVIFSGTITTAMAANNDVSGLRRRWVVTRPSQPATMGWVNEITTPGRHESYTHVLASARTEREWVITRAAQSARYELRSVVVTPGR